MEGFSATSRMPSLVLEGDDGPAAGDALAGILRLVLHHLLGRDVVGERHQRQPRPAGSLGQHGLAVRRDLVLGDLAEAGAGDDFTVGKIPRTRSGPPVPRSSSAASMSASSGHAEGLVRGACPVRKSFLSESRASLPPEPWREVVGLLVAAAGDVVLEEPPHARAARRSRRRSGTTTRPCIAVGQVHPDHLAELVGLALEGEVLALDLLVVLELGLEQAGHLHGGAGGAGDADAREVVGLEDLLDAPVGDLVALAWPAGRRP